MQVACETNVITPVCTVLRFLEVSSMPTMGILMESYAISASFLYCSTHLDLPVVCKKFSCPQGNSRRGALMGDGADGCSVYARCESDRRSATREKDMMDDISTTDVLYGRHTMLMLERQRRWWLVTLMFHARMPGG